MASDGEEKKRPLKVLKELNSSLQLHARRIKLAVRNEALVHDNHLKDTDAFIQAGTATEDHVTKYVG